ncbi:MAG: oxygen-independent coproporphyrinogen III oxidase [Pseudomonadales bacterium]
MTEVDLDLIRRYNVSGPRYTSYPTALQFGDFDEADYRHAVAASGRAARPLSLYCHIPFCSTLCYYCACSKIVTRDRGKGVRYVQHLQREIDLHAPLYAGRVVSQLHWGGGTPTFLDDDQVDALMAHIRQRFSMAARADGEFSIEIDPRTVDAGRIRRLWGAGFNRLSMGVQDFEPAVQKAVNRRQSFEATQAAMQAARAVGFGSISVDLIYGLPHQTPATVARTLEQVVALSPDRISIYNYAHLPDRFTPQQRINVTDLPAAETKLALLKLCIEQLTGAGYCYIGMDHFAKPDDELAIAQRNGTLQRNFQGYSTFADCDMVAMGVTAISQVGNVYAQNAKTLDAYESLVARGVIPIVKGVTIDAEDRLRKAVIMTLICQFALQFAPIEAAYGIDFRNHFAAELARLEDMRADALLAIDADGIRVTEQGRLLIRNICMVFDRYLNPAAQTSRFSKAI